MISFTPLPLYPREVAQVSCTAYYWDSFILLYVDDVRTSQKINPWTSTACYRVSFTFYIWMIFVPHRTPTYGPPRPFTGIVLLFYMFVPHRKDQWAPMVCYRDDFIFLYVDDVRNKNNVSGE
jgi:hypothetical protein